MTDRKILFENIIECYLTENNLTETEANEIVSLNKDLKAINYMRCSLQLKKLEVPKFHVWMKQFGYAEDKECGILRKNGYLIKGHELINYRQAYENLFL
jgi:hypothetical protein